jgi:hypothetical protein
VFEEDFEPFDHRWLIVDREYPVALLYRHRICPISLIHRIPRQLPAVNTYTKHQL